jgi:hypothetical protein
MLLDMGYKPHEIFEEYRQKINGDKSFIVDVVGIDKTGKKGSTAIECGHTEASKASTLGLFFDEVILLPFNIKIMSPELQKEILKKENVIRELEEKIKILEREKTNLEYRYKTKETEYRELYSKEVGIKNLIKWLLFAFGLEGEIYPETHRFFNSSDFHYDQLKAESFIKFSSELSLMRGNTNVLLEKIKNAGAENKILFKHYSTLVIHLELFSPLYF